MFVIDEIAAHAKTATKTNNLPIETDQTNSWHKTTTEEDSITP
jgi:hypothetical protein